MGWFNQQPVHDFKSSWDRFGSFPYGSIVTERQIRWLWGYKKNSEPHQGILGSSFHSQLRWERICRVGWVLTQENELGEVLVAVMGGSTEAKVVTSTGASVQVDAAVLQQLGTTWGGGMWMFFFVGQILFGMMWFFCGSKIQVQCFFRGKVGEVETEIDMLLHGKFKASDRCGSANCFGTYLNKDAWC